MKQGGASDSKERKLEKRIEKAKRPHSTYQDALIVGVAFCIVAGSLLALSSVLSWAEIRTSASSVEHRYFTDLVRLSGNMGLEWAMPFGGIALAVTSVAQLSRTIVEGRWKREVAVVTLALGVGTTLIAIISMFSLQDLVIKPAGSSAGYGPGVFFCVFGSVLAIAGSLTLFADVMRDEEKSELPERWAKSRETSEEKEYVLPPEKPKGKGMKCPKCGAQVKPGWDECPICGAELE
jgi:hypothetical protein